jgi:hypothetical protein
MCSVKWAEPFALLRIVDLADVDDQRCGGLVELRIGHQQHPQAVFQREAPEHRRVGRRDDARREVRIGVAAARSPSGADARNSNPSDARSRFIIVMGWVDAGLIRADGVLTIGRA